MLDMCKYNMASQQDSTTQSIYSLGSEEPDITNMGLMTQQSEHTSQSTSGSYHVWVQTSINEKAEKPDYLSDPAEGTRS